MVAKLAFSIASRLILQPYFRLTRAQTLGVRAIVRDDEGAFLLVRHTYAPGWMFPGGGVDRAETLEAAIVRELREEVSIDAQSRPSLFGVYANLERFRGDHIALFVVTEWRRNRELAHSLEIAEHGFFPANGLPDGATGATRRRIRELLDGTVPDEHW